MPFVFIVTGRSDGAMTYVSFSCFPLWTELAPQVSGWYRIPADCLGLSYFNDDGDEVFIGSNAALQLFYRNSVRAKDTLHPYVWLRFTACNLGPRPSSMGASEDAASATPASVSAHDNISGPSMIILTPADDHDGSRCILWQATQTDVQVSLAAGAPAPPDWARQEVEDSQSVWRTRCLRDMTLMLPNGRCSPSRSLASRQSRADPTTTNLPSPPVSQLPPPLSRLA